MFEGALALERAEEVARPRAPPTRDTRSPSEGARRGARAGTRAAAAGARGGGGRADAPPARAKRIAEGVVEVLANGLRVRACQTARTLPDDLYISSAQVHFAANSSPVTA